MNCARELKNIIECALKEDIGRKDITTESVIPKNKKIKAVLLAKENCVACGINIAALAFKLKDSRIKFRPIAKDGQNIKKGRIIARIEGKARNILTTERVALNFLTLLSGVATQTRKYVKAIKPYKAKILDTRKTIPLLRELEKYAVRIGGGYNHRLSLDEMILIKDNHLKITNGYYSLPSVTRGYQVEIEVKNLKEFKDALKLKPDIIMLDNMSINDIRRAVMIRNVFPATNRRIKLEASGGITLKNIRQFAATGVEMISVGCLTHSLVSPDISLEVL